MKKENRFWIYAFITIGIVLIINNSCKKEEEKKVSVLTTTAATAITTTTATIGGNVTSDGNATITERGVCYSTTTSPTTASGKLVAAGTTGIFTSNLTSLTAGTTYYVRAYATNSVGTAYGIEVNFTTIPLAIPTLITNEVTLITTTTATSDGDVISDGNAAITERGVCYATIQGPNTANSKITATGTTGTFSCSLVGLTPATTYYARAYAINSVGTAYGNEKSFTTYDVDAISDIDNNYYNIITIGTQTWMKENLKTTKYRNGDPISNITDNTSWYNQTVGAYCWYSNNIANKTTYGALYNWYAVMDSRNLCPTGSHIPSDDEWTTLETYLGGSSIAGDKLKANTLWISPITNADNSSGFTALPGGFRGNLGDFYNTIGFYGYWWSTMEYAGVAWSRSLYSNGSNLYRAGFNGSYGFSVRCLKDL